MALTESWVAGPATPAVRDITLGQLLEQAAKSAPDRLALIAAVPDPTLRRQWTYSEFYAEAQRTGTRAALPLQAPAISARWTRAAIAPWRAASRT
jgi:hypothetical protein